MAKNVAAAVFGGDGEAKMDYVTPEIEEKVRRKEQVTIDDANAAFAKAGIVNPLQLTEAQKEAQAKARRLRKLRRMPTFEEVLLESIQRVSPDLKAQMKHRETVQLAAPRKAQEVLSLQGTSAHTMIRRQKHTILIEQGQSMASSYMQATAFGVSSVSAALMTVLGLAVAYQVHFVFLGITPLTATMAWRSWEGFESVAEDIRFQKQARDLRDVKRAHVPEYEFFKKDPTPLEQKREQKRLETEAALARQQKLTDDSAGEGGAAATAIKDGLGDGGEERVLRQKRVPQERSIAGSSSSVAEELRKTRPDVV